MSSLLASFHHRPGLLLLLAFSFFLLPACAGLGARVTDRSVAKHPKYQKLMSENKKLLETLESVESDTAQIRLRMLEQEAQVQELQGRLDSQQKMLDEAIVEVVRAKAKLRSLESKAEAASEMAEAEIAITILKARLAGQVKNPEIVKAEKLITMAVKEFQQENYGGAVFLTSQAKGHIKTAQMRLDGRKERLEARRKLSPVAGETLFALPIQLQALKTSNLRKAPDLKSTILTTLDKGTPLIGYSHKGEWVRVLQEDGTSGWIFQTLVGSR